MEYGITKMVLGGGKQFISLSKEKLDEARTARNVLIEALRIEEKFELLLENYLEYENDLTKISNQFMVLGGQDYDWFQAHQNLINRRILNLLSACRFYQDQVSHQFSSLYGKRSEQSILIKEKFSQMYDSYFGYRIMESYRNYTQHRGFPIHVIKLNARRLKQKEAKDKLRYGLTPKINLEKLKTDKKFKKEILEEVKDADFLDVKPLIREYISCFGEIQNEVRNVFHEEIEVSEKIIGKLIEDFKNEYGSDTDLVGLSVVAKKDRVIKESISIELNDVNNRRQKLSEKNSSLKGLNYRYSTNEIIED